MYLIRVRLASDTKASYQSEIQGSLLSVGELKPIFTPVRKIFLILEHWLIL